MDENFKILLPQIVELFMRYGIRSMTMDDISRHLKISKKTLYQYVDDKNDLVVKVFQSVRFEDECEVKKVITAEQNAIDQMYEIVHMVSGKLQGIHPSIFYDLEKYHADAWRIFTDYKYTFIHQCISDNIKKGIKEGFYRKDLAIDIVVKIYLNNIDSLFNNEAHPIKDFTPYKAYLELFRYHIHGIASEKGLEYLTKKLKKESAKTELKK